jgi:hypothetical protein
MSLIDALLKALASSQEIIKTTLIPAKRALVIITSIEVMFAGLLQGLKKVILTRS